MLFVVFLLLKTDGYQANLVTLTSFLEPTTPVKHHLIIPINNQIVTY